ncbi:hypothetical protein E7Y35_02350 [Spiroplasma sp. SV19]|nr:hypothetical protein E7Y35_02350 [Spiroplasma sp. SV19]
MKPNLIGTTDVTIIKHSHIKKSNLIHWFNIKKILAYTISNSITTSGLISTLLKRIATIPNKKDLKKLIIHSDQSVIYITTKYI